MPSSCAGASGCLPTPDMGVTCGRTRGDYALVACHAIRARGLPCHTRSKPRPAQVTQRGPGHWLIDVGREVQGGVTVTFANASSGDVVRVGYGEEAVDSFVQPSQPNSTIPGCAACTVRCCPMRTTNVFLSAWTLRLIS